MLLLTLKGFHALSTGVLMAGLALPPVGIARAEPPQPRLGTASPQQQGVQRLRATTTPMARCLASWDRSTQMSKREWKETCRRVVKTNPGLYNKPF
jgi:hypothetical protein